jgi:uncharacterized protein YbbC (DUF1343 family)
MAKVMFPLLMATFLLANIHLQPVPKGMSPVRTHVKTDADITVAAARTELWLPLLAGKRVGLIANQTSLVGNVHLADLMIEKGIALKKVFGPEHGFRGQAGAGEKVGDSKDPKTGLPVISLYGKNKKPSPEQLADLDVLVFDIQDVGARFYTYISTMALCMEAAADAGLPFIVLDRPNPNGHYVDGPVLDPKFSSFVGMHRVPVVHGMTVGEYAGMVNGEHWLSNGKILKLTVIPCKNYQHTDLYQLPVAPSPNLPNMAAVYLYPSLCFFEGTPVSVGRGTDKPFQLLGYPGLKGSIQFTPRSLPESAPNPPHLDKLCGGYDLSAFATQFLRDYGKLYFLWLTDLYARYPEKESFFTPFFDKLAGTTRLREDIQAGKDEDKIRKTWEGELRAFKQIRKKYLLYPDDIE